MTKDDVGNKVYQYIFENERLGKATFSKLSCIEHEVYEVIENKWGNGKLSIMFRKGGIGDWFFDKCTKNSSIRREVWLLTRDDEKAKEIIEQSIVEELTVESTRIERLLRIRNEIKKARLSE